MVILDLRKYKLIYVTEVELTKKEAELLKLYANGEYNKDEDVIKTLGLSSKSTLVQQIRRSKAKRNIDFKRRTNYGYKLDVENEDLVINC